MHRTPDRTSLDRTVVVVIMSFERLVSVESNNIWKLRSLRELCDRWALPPVASEKIPAVLVPLATAHLIERSMWGSIVLRVGHDFGRWRAGLNVAADSAVNQALVDLRREAQLVAKGYYSGVLAQSKTIMRPPFPACRNRSPNNAMTSWHGYRHPRAAQLHNSNNADPCRNNMFTYFEGGA